MAKKNLTMYVCSDCGHEEDRWMGRCMSCGEWNTLKEFRVSPSGGSTRGSNGGRSAGSASAQSGDLRPIGLGQITPPTQTRLTSGIGELDRVLGGGLMRGSSILISGEPGIGKSTLMLQAAASYQAAGTVLYVSGEEGGHHIKLRADRLGLDAGEIQVLSNPRIEAILPALDEIAPSVIIIDSIQTLVTDEVDSSPGSVNQMKISVARISEWARIRNAGVFFVAHVTKEGAIAGPKLIEHMVDGVLMFEHSGGEVRFLRGLKNRFGSVDEVGLFHMSDSGLEELADPSSIFLVERTTPMPPGVVAAPIFEGSRILVVEIQALTVPAQGGYGRIYSDKIDARRISRICAVLEKHAGVRLSDQDVYVNVAGGMRIGEVGIELPTALAIMSARTGQALSRRLAVTGEVSLSGELRPVSHLRQRFTAAADLGFKHQIGPRTTSAPGPGTKGTKGANGTIAESRSPAQAWKTASTIQDAIKLGLSFRDEP